MICVHAEFDFLHAFLVIWLSWVIMRSCIYLPKSSFPGYRQAEKAVVDLYFANYIRQPERKLPRPIYNQDLEVSNHLTSVMWSHLLVSKSMG